MTRRGLNFRESAPAKTSASEKVVTAVVPSGLTRVGEAEEAE